MKNKIIISILTIVLLALNLLLIYLFVDNKNSLFLSLGYLIIMFLLYRVLLFFTQKILVKLNILEYKSDNFDHYGDEHRIREISNVKYKMQKDRVFSGILYNVIFAILVFLVVKFNNDEGIISCIFVAVLLSIPSLIFLPRLNEWDGLGSFRDIQLQDRQKNKTKKIRATTWDFGGYKETTYRDEDGNKLVKATSFDWGPVTDTTIEDKDGNKTKIEHWKY